MWPLDKRDADDLFKRNDQWSEEDEEGEGSEDEGEEGREEEEEDDESDLGEYYNVSCILISG